jgi:hypothetical protein
MLKGRTSRYSKRAGVFRVAIVSLLGLVAAGLSAPPRAAADEPVRVDCHYQYIYGVRGKNNCHGFVWQSDYIIPTTLPNYAIRSDEVCKFYARGCSAPYDPCYVNGSGREGDKVVYSNDHSAVVWAATTNPPLFISYCWDYPRPRIHRPDDPAGIYAYKFNYGSPIAFYRYHLDVNVKKETGGNPIRVVYNKEFAVEVDGAKYTAYLVNNTDEATSTFFWLAVPYHASYPFYRSADGPWWNKTENNAVYSSLNNLQEIWNRYPADVDELHIYVYQYNDTLGYHWIHENRERSGGIVPRPHNDFENQASVRCLDADMNTIANNGTKVQLWDCHGGANQWFSLLEDMGGQIVNVYSGRCLDADTNTIGSNGTKVQLWDCHGGTNQQWYRDGDRIRNRASGRCLDADINTIGDNGTKVHLWDCHDGSNQQW